MSLILKPANPHVFTRWLEALRAARKDSIKCENVKSLLESYSLLSPWPMQVLWPNQSQHICGFKALIPEGINKLEVAIATKCHLFQASCLFSAYQHNLVTIPGEINENIIKEACNLILSCSQSFSLAPYRKPEKSKIPESKKREKIFFIFFDSPVSENL